MPTNTSLAAGSAGRYELQALSLYATCLDSSDSTVSGGQVVFTFHLDPGVSATQIDYLISKLRATKLFKTVLTSTS